MANAFKVLYRGSASTSLATIYTAPASTTTLISSFVISNTGTSSATYDINLNDVAIANDVDVPANDSVILELKQVLETGQTIKALASTTNVKFHVSGLEIS